MLFRVGKSRAFVDSRIMRSRSSSRSHAILLLYNHLFVLLEDTLSAWRLSVGRKCYSRVKDTHPCIVLTLPSEVVGVSRDRKQLCQKCCGRSPLRFFSTSSSTVPSACAFATGRALSVRRGVVHAQRVIVAFSPPPLTHRSRQWPFSTTTLRACALPATVAR